MNRFTSLSFNHQPNGRALPLSRSWNRIIGEVGLARGNIGLITCGRGGECRETRWTTTIPISMTTSAAASYC